MGKRRLQFDRRVRLRFRSIKPLAAGSLPALGKRPLVFLFFFSSTMLEGGIQKAAGAVRDCRQDTGIQQPHRRRDARPGLRHGCSHAGPLARHSRPRRGRYRVTRRIDRHGAEKELPELRNMLASDCPKRTGLLSIRAARIFAAAADW
jgi:hypothetical protein